MHANAPLTPTGRKILCERIDRGRPVAHVAREMGISRPTAYKWWNRYCEGGEEALVDRRSVPHSSPSRLSQRRERRIIGLRVNRRWGPARIGGHLGLCRSTVWRVLSRYGISRLRNLDAPSGRQIRRYERKVPGELAHMDVKKFGKIPRGGGWRTRGHGSAGPRQRVGYTYLHSLVDDHSRLAYSEFCPDETAVTSLRFTQRAVQWFANRGVTITSILTDNGPPYVSYLFAHTLEAVGIRHLRTSPYSPQTNGKVERYQRTLATEWAYTTAWTSDQQRVQALTDWLHTYNHHRYHTAIDGAPISRVNNLREHYT